MKVVSVGDISEQVRGVTYSKSESSEEPRPGYVAVLRANNITDEGLSFDHLVYVPIARVSAKQRLHDHDVVIAASSGSLSVVGKAAQARQAIEGSFGAFCKVLRPKDKVDPLYFGHFFRTTDYRRTVSGLAAGANINNLKNEHLDNLQIPLPPLPEQKRIAAILDAADALRAKRRESLEQLDSLVQATFLEMFGDPVTNPKGWKQALFGDVIADGPQNGIYKPATDYGSGVRILRIDGFYDGAMTKVENLKQVRVTSIERNKYSLSEGDIVINRVNSRSHLGKSALIPKLNELVIFESNMMRLKLFSARMHGCFAIHLLQTPFIGSQILRSAKDAVNQSSINQSDVKGFTVYTPPLELQDRFASVVKSIEEQKSRLNAHLAELDALFSSLQSRAFNGELVA